MLPHLSAKIKSLIRDRHLVPVGLLAVSVKTTVLSLFKCVVAFTLMLEPTSRG